MIVSAELSQKIQKTIDEFAADSEPFLVGGETSGESFDLREMAAEILVLPLAFDWLASFGLQPNGATIYFTFEKPSKINHIGNQKIINMVYFRAAEKYPGLEELRPVRNAESIICPGCEGTGILKEFADNEILATGVVCNCGGVGWLPGSDEKYFYFNPFEINN